MIADRKPGPWDRRTLALLGLLLAGMAVRTAITFRPAAQDPGLTWGPPDLV